MKSIDQNIENLLKPIFKGDKKKFLLINNLIKNWSDIVGKKNAKQSKPQNVSFEKNNQLNQNRNYAAKLTIEVDNSAIGFIINSNQEIIIEKINSLYGFAAIKKIIVKQNPKKDYHNQAKSLSQLSESELKINENNQKKITNILSNIDDIELKEILSKLGNIIINNG